MNMSVKMLSNYNSNENFVPNKMDKFRISIYLCLITFSSLPKGVKYIKVIPDLPRYELMLVSQFNEFYKYP